MTGEAAERVHDDSVYRSQPVEDRQSIFLGLYSPSLPARELQADAQIENASHRILAWRVPGKQRSIQPSAKPLLETGFDDDGESWAGKRVLKVMEDYKVEGTICVARWYGGVMLGPARFKWIEHVAGEAVLEARRAPAPSSAQKRKRQADELAEKEEVIAELKETDARIVILRGLLAEKKGEATTEKEPGTPRRDPGYERMPLTALRKLERARDKTVEFILGEIDRIEREHPKGQRENLNNDEDVTDSAATSTIKSISRDDADKKSESPSSNVAKESSKVTQHFKDTD